MKNVGSLDDESKFIHGGDSKMTPEEIKATYNEVADIKAKIFTRLERPWTWKMANRILDIISALETQQAISLKLAEYISDDLMSCPADIFSDYDVGECSIARKDNLHKCWLKWGKDQVEQGGK